MNTWFHVLATLGDVSGNTAVQGYWEHTAFISLDVHPIMGLSDHIEFIMLLFEELLCILDMVHLQKYRNLYFDQKYVSVQATFSILGKVQMIQNLSFT